MQLQRLANQDVSGFDCGLAALNTWLQRQARQSMRGRSAVVYLAYEGELLVGYFSLSNSSVLTDDAPVRIRAGQPGVIPLLLIGRFAIDVRSQGQRRGKALLGRALALCLEVAERSGVVAIRVDASNEAAARFWRSVAGFEAGPKDPRTLFLPIKQVAKALGGDPLS